MNLSEFKAWFEGFTDNLDGPPGPKAWEKICERVKGIKVDPTPWPVFVDRYVPRYPRHPFDGNYWLASTGSHVQALATQSAQQNAVPNTMPYGTTPAMAFQQLGKLEAETLGETA